MGNPEPASSDAARVRGMVLASELPLPGEHEVDEALVAAAAAHLNRTITGRSLELACEIGKYVLEVFFAGDLARFRERGRKHRSFQALAEHGGLQYSAIWLWRAVGIHEQLSLLPPDVASALPYTHHTLLLSLERPDEKVEVGQRAVSGGWTRNQLQAEVTRRRASGRRGRPPIPPLVKALHRIETLLSDDALEGLDAVGDLPLDEQQKLHRSLRRMLRRLETMVDELQPIFSSK